MDKPSVKKGIGTVVVVVLLILVPLFSLLVLNGSYEALYLFLGGLVISAILIVVFFVYYSFYYRWARWCMGVIGVFLLWILVVIYLDDIKKVDKVEEVATPVVAPIKEPEEVVPVAEAKPEPIKKEEELTEFEKKKKALEEEFKRTEKILREDEFFREEFGVSDRGSLTFINKDGTPDESNVPVGNLDELIEELKHPTIKEEKIVEKNGISISISYPERIEAESLEKIKSGIWE